MKAAPKFLRQDKVFWANVRTISQGCGYTNRKTKAINVPSLGEIASLYSSLQLNTDKLFSANGPTEFGALLLEYLAYRAQVLNEQVKVNLMTLAEAVQVLEELLERHHFQLLIEEKKGKKTAFLVSEATGQRFRVPMNLQRGEKKGPAYFTVIIALIVKIAIGDHPCDFNPMQLTSVTRDGLPLRTLARRVDGAFPQIINPIAIWEVKEYYFTTTFGSRVADGVYESLLDGLELEELRDHEEIDVKHYLMVDDFGTWWGKGRSYLCRIIDMLHMGYVDEVFFGKEVLDSLPLAVVEWLKHPAANSSPTNAEGLL